MRSIRVHKQISLLLALRSFMTHLEDYLQYYSSVDAPGFAVLVTGEWGTGKTFQVLKCLPKDERIYVSLYGLKSAEQVHAEVFAAAHPSTASKRGFLDKFRGKDVGALGFSVPLGFVPEIANAFLRNEVEAKRTLIFDDLERSNLPLNEVLGVINSYVEHKNFRVIVIAHDDEQLLGQEFKEVKEKTFGQTFLVEPQVDSALQRFLSEVKQQDSRNFAEKHKEHIERVFKLSGVKSLRVLRHSVSDLTRLHKALSPTHLANSEAMEELVQLFAALSIEARSGRLSEADLCNRRRARMGYLIRAQGKRKAEVEKPPFVAADERYATIELESGMLNDQVLVSTLIHGRFSSSDIQSSVNNSQYFLVPEDVPPWKVVIHFDELSDEDVETARKRMEQQFEGREVTDSGEMLHIFCLRMLMAEQGILDQSVEEVVKQSKEYIDDLLESKKMPPRGTDWRWFDEFDRSYAGFAYWVSEANAGHFKEMWDHLIAAREEALRQTFPQVRADLLAMVRNDPKAFFEAVSPTNNGHNPYASIPLLNDIAVAEFVDAWLEAPQDSWRLIDRSLQNRFSHGQIDRDLKDEKDWALDVLKELEARAQKEGGFRALRIRRLRPRVLLEIAQDDAGKSS